jgi:hypothetical protein
MVLKSEGYELKSTNHGPDFVIETDSKRVFIEAVCPGPGDEGSPNSVSPIVHGAPIAQDVPVPQIVLRIRSALKETAGAKPDRRQVEGVTQQCASANRRRAERSGTIRKNLNATVAITGRLRRRSLSWDGGAARRSWQVGFMNTAFVVFDQMTSLDFIGFYHPVTR